MRFDGLDLNLLVALEALIEERNVSAAARRIHLSQPAVTGALKRLREYFNDELLEQSGRRMFLTPKAEALASPVRRALFQIRGEITRAGSFDPTTTSRHFVISASDYAYTILLAKVIAKASTLAPFVTFEIMPPNEQVNERFERAEIDLLVTVDKFALQGHTFTELWRDEEVIISCQKAGFDKIDEDTFFACGHAVATFGLEHRASIADKHVDQKGRKRRVEVQLPEFGALCQGIVGTKRLATMHRRYALHYAKLYPIKLHQTWEHFPEIIEGMQWHKVRDMDPGLLWLRGLLEDGGKNID
ncbi:LysR family transcriptional regulator [Alteromonas sp. CI.11.F.A3]|uniref:LysR family transcriptional regulator n=1 Tax=unclassified Alteromonas TaxID=2614992 RepID=UPI001B3A3C51|nr:MULTISPECIES: LysR family transcriptional regulator [unclassified Alteromonas]MBQ4828450.1 LysR family transcriptional regulator [Alteromonas sp. MMG017]WOI36379.1 LysR family transcriptional regulator [Alteromonas sp. CI.11.F.A3]